MKYLKDFDVFQAGWRPRQSIEGEIGMIYETHVWILR